MIIIIIMIDYMINENNQSLYECVCVYVRAYTHAKGGW